MNTYVCVKESLFIVMKCLHILPGAKIANTKKLQKYMPSTVSVKNKQPIEQTMKHEI